MAAGRSEEVEAARLLLARMGIDPADLVVDGRSRASVAPPRSRPVPTFREWIPVVAELVAPRTAETYGTPRSLTRQFRKSSPMGSLADA